MPDKNEYGIEFRVLGIVIFIILIIIIGITIYLGIPEHKITKMCEDKGYDHFEKVQQDKYNCCKTITIIEDGQYINKKECKVLE
jgi:hypothetical protein